MPPTVIKTRVRETFTALEPVMDERTRRLWAATEANAIGHGGQTVVAQATGMSRSTLPLGRRELGPGGGAAMGPGRRVRRHGGGGKALVQHDPTLLADLDALVEPTRRAVDLQACSATG